MGEGAGILVIERLETALARGANIVAELSGYGSTADAHHITAPSGEGSRRCMRMALADADLTADAVQYINAHGTSTPIGDQLELDAIKDVFGASASSVSVSSTKSMHGHMLGAAGAVEAILSCRAMATGRIPPTINLDRPSEGCDLDLTPHESRARDIDAVMSNSFGFGGTNTTLVFRRFEAEA